MKLATSKYKIKSKSNFKTNSKLKHPLPSEEITSYYFNLTPAMLEKFMEIRNWIYELSFADEKIGEIEECLKWGEPSFLTPKTKSGSTIRMAKVNDSEFALYFNCKTSIAKEISIEFPEFNCDGKRALYLSASNKLPKTKLIVCLKKALLYHKRKSETNGYS
ncbi:hypothetical protein ND856_02630 [Leptospira bandrabouensis]|uniref:hypothetical protein n=1 Tax=Leptospira bandrabouensis TaxID=2484903 RepID=UPI00223E3540|nr:hypothetical protein [Leptospira bandrabouensis]MCW7457556.1 hypothetical protein [Leptospira bandrabouensis]MCW7476168.1 hypothetical protein [Leptospira bandrabouensis]MCW7483850.1 hypothetical protein [Leptospira bandrabouensis]